MAFRRIANFIFYLVFAGVAVFSVTFLYRNYQEPEAMRAEEKVAEAKLNELKRKSDQRELALTKLESDKDYVEDTIRKKLGYAKENEVIFRFE